MVSVTESAIIILNHLLCYFSVYQQRTLCKRTLDYILLDSKSFQFLVLSAMIIILEEFAFSYFQ